MTTPVDPNDVLMTGENSFVRLSHDGGKTLADRWSHWRVLWCPAGPGHVLLVQAELTGGKPRIYSDNIAMTRWLQRAIESMLFPPSAEPALPVIEASFERSGDPRGVATERVVSADDEIVLAWYDFNDPFVLTMAPGYREPADRRLQHVLPGPGGPGDAERPGRRRQRLARDAGRPPVVERLPGLVGDLGQAESVGGAVEDPRAQMASG